MRTCPVCNTPLPEGSEHCPACGYHLQGSTEEFKAVSLDPKDTVIEEVPTSPSTITVLNGRQKGIAFPLEGDSAVIGRSPRCEIFLNDMTVSRKHAVLERVAGGWSIRDTGSFNGVWVNNVNVDHAMLSDKDLIQIGSFILRYGE